MAKHIGKRLLMGIVSIFALITVTFFLVHLMPGNPFNIENVNQAVQDRLMSYYGLDRPPHEQFGMYLEKLLQGDLGISYKKVGMTVNELIALKAPATIQLGLIAYVLALVLGTALGIVMAVTRREVLRGGIMFVTVLGISIPNYVLALILMLVLGVQLDWFPVLGLDTPLGVVAEICDKIVIMYGGQIVERGTVKEIFNEAKHPYTRGLLDSIGKVETERTPLRYIPGTPPNLLVRHPGCTFCSRCDKAMKICRAYKPTETVFSDGHSCSCWLYCRDRAEELVQAQDEERQETI